MHLTHPEASITHILRVPFTGVGHICGPSCCACVGQGARGRGTEEGGHGPGTHQSVAGTQGRRPDAGAPPQDSAPEMAGGRGGGRHLHAGQVPVPPLHDVALGQELLVDRQVENQVPLLVGDSVVHPVLGAPHVPLPAAAGEGRVQAVGQEVPLSIHAHRGHHVVFWQGLDEMLWGKEDRVKQRSEANALPLEPGILAC